MNRRRATRTLATIALAGSVSVAGTTIYVVSHGGGASARVIATGTGAVATPTAQTGSTGAPAHRAPVGHQQVRRPPAGSLLALLSPAGNLPALLPPAVHQARRRRAGPPAPRARSSSARRATR
jgi:hypothetical protein